MALARLPKLALPDVKLPVTLADVVIDKLLPPILPVIVALPVADKFVKNPLAGVVLPTIPSTLPIKLPLNVDAPNEPVIVRLPPLMLPVALMLPVVVILPTADMFPVLISLVPCMLPDTAISFFNSTLIVPLLVIGLPVTVND